jgi:hypothetical protein
MAFFGLYARRATAAFTKLNWLERWSLCAPACLALIKGLFFSYIATCVFVASLGTVLWAQSGEHPDRSAPAVMLGDTLELLFSFDNSQTFKQVISDIPAVGWFAHFLWLPLTGSILAWTLSDSATTKFKASIGRKRCAECFSEDVTLLRTASESYETTETRIRRSMHFNSDGEESGYSETEYEVPTLERYTLHYFRCNKCGSCWSK